MIDKLKLTAAVLCLIAGIVVFYLLEGDAPAVVRVLAVLVGLLVGLAVAYTSEPGKQFFAFAGESRDETRKVAWPSRREATQMTLVVFGMVLVMALFLWAVDSLLFQAVEVLVRGG